MNRSLKTTITALLATAASFAVAPGALAAPAKHHKPVQAAGFTVSAPATTPSDTGFDATVTAVTKQGKRVKDFRGKVALTIDGGPAAPVHAMSSADKGRFVFEGVRASGVGTSRIDARSGKLAGRTAIAVTHGAAVAIEIDAPTQVSAGQGIEPNVRAVDRFGEPTGGAVELSIGPDGSCEADYCSATKAGRHILTASQGALSASAEVLVSAGPIDRLAVAPVSNGSVEPRIPAGAVSASFERYEAATQSTEYRVVGLDAFGNSYGDLTSEATITAGGTSCPGGVCPGGVASPGQQTVTAKARGAVGTSTLTVMGEENAYRMTCAGLHNFDMNDSMSDGCEYENPYAANHSSESTAFDLGSLPCQDDRSKIEITDQIAYDRRGHSDIAGYGSNVGAPIYYTFRTSGGTFCVNDMYLTLHTSNGSIADKCLAATVIYPSRTMPVTFQTGGNNTVKLVTDYGYATGDRFTLKLTQQCWQSTPGIVDISIDGHL